MFAHAKRSGINRDVKEKNKTFKRSPKRNKRSSGRNDGGFHHGSGWSCVPWSESDEGC
ncbi:hypothetical protein OS493_027598 [Desmophyllum pertusum]|uniref:Uncharacterized protein n=1 Tax=Desmophyllum pertusum TaxID=174260 RepID=A0A9X0D914_9CNID|nr:hypothetical protein OS493_027598 [Desmophyllum pertusum]